MTIATPCGGIIHYNSGWYLGRERAKKKWIQCYSSYVVKGK